MRTLIWAVVFATAAGIAGAGAQSYPTRPVTLIVPFPAGGPSDTLARVLADTMRGPLGQPVIIENISGAGGSVGTARLARAAPDGYTVGLGHVQTHVINPATQTLTFDAVKDFTPVALIADTPQWLVARGDFPAADFKDFIAWLKANPGKMTSGTVGAGGPSDVAAYYFQQHTGTKFTLVPYKGGAPLIQDLIAGHIDTTFGQAANYLPHTRSGKLKPYAVFAAKRWWAAPDTPTIEEAGGPPLHSSYWHGLWAPKDTPKEIVATLGAAISKALTDAELKKRFAAIGQEVWPPDRQTPEALAAQQKAEIEKWWPIIKAAGLKAN